MPIASTVFSKSSEMKDLVDCTEVSGRSLDFTGKIWWFKPVSTISRECLVRTIKLTKFFHVTRMLRIQSQLKFANCECGYNFAENYILNLLVTFQESKFGVTKFIFKMKACTTKYRVF